MPSCTAMEVDGLVKVNPYLIGLFCTTLGQDGENLGSDAADVIMVCWVVVSVQDEKVLVTQRCPVRPADLSKVTQEILNERDITEGLSTCPSLQETLQRFEEFAEAEYGINGVINRAVFVVDGIQPLRQVLHPESARKDFKLPNRYFQFYDIRKEYGHLLNNNETINSIADILKLIGKESNTSELYGLRHCHDLSTVIIHLLQENKLKGAQCFREPEVIKPTLEYGICTKDENIDGNCVVRARGLPWQSSDHDVAKFFAGLNIAKGGVALCLSQQGRRNGEALVRFESVEQRDLALRRHRHFMGNRYIEVYRATGEDFINVAAGSNNEAQDFLSKESAVIIRMRGLPYDCTAIQIVDFFNSGPDESRVSVMDGERGILFVNKADGRATGDAFVLVPSEEDAQKALAKHKEVIGSRYIELFRSTTAEVQQVVNKSMEPSKPLVESPLAASQGLIGAIPPPSLPALTTAPLSGLLPQQLIISGSRKDCIRLRGLPYEAQVQHILDFLGDFSKHIVFQGVHMVYNAQGHPSGEAFIQMDSEQSAGLCATDRHNKYMQIGKKQRYIEVFQCSADDMNLVLTGPATIPTSPTLVAPGRPLLSPVAAANALLPPNSALFPHGAAAAAFSQPLLSPQLLNANVLQNGALAAALQPALAAAVQAGARLPMLPGGLLAGMAGVPGAVFYWPYPPSPPVSPASYYAAATTQPQAPGIVLMRGVPFNTTYADIMNFFSGFEISPECIQFQRMLDGRPTGDAIVQFTTRNDAERAVIEKNRHLLGMRTVELYIYTI